MNLIKKKTLFILQSLNKEVFIFVSLLLFSFPLVGQEKVHYFAFDQATSQEIFSILSTDLGIAFNYNDDELSQEQYSFSIEGSSTEVINNVCRVLKKPYVYLEDEVVAIQPGIKEYKDENIDIKGQVIDASGTGLPYCTIIVKGTGTHFQTDLDGNFTINGIYADREVIVFSYVGFGEQQRTWEALRDDHVLVMYQNENLLGEILIRDYLRINSTNDVLNTQRLRGDLIAVAGMGDGDLLATAQVLPGVYTTSESLSDLQIRGGPPDQVDYKWNGIKLLQSSLFYGKVSGVNPFLVDELSVTRDGASADQSGQASGSIIMKNNQGVNNELRIKAFTDMLYGNLSIKLPIIKNRISAQVAYRGSYSNLFRSPLFDAYFDQIFQFGQLQNDQFYIDFFNVRGQENIDHNFRFRDFSSTLDILISSKTDLKLSYLKVGNRFSYDYYDGFFNEFTKRDQLQLSNSGVSAILNHRFNDRLKLESNITRSVYDNSYNYKEDINSGNRPRDRFINNGVDQYQGNVQITYTQDKYKINVGLQHEHWAVRYSDTTFVPGVGLYQIVEFNESNEQSAFVTGVWKWIPKMTLETGLRYSDFAFSLVDRKFYEPRLHASYRWFENFTIHAHYGKYHQNLNRRLFSNPLQTEQGIWFVSDERPEAPNFIWVVQNQQFSMGAAQTYKNWKFTADVYHKKAENIWTSALDFSNTEDPFAFADLDINGIELSSLYQNQWLRLLWTYEYVDENMAIKVENPFTIKSPFTQKHKLSLLQNFNFDNWEISTRWKYGSGRFYSVGQFLELVDEEDKGEVYRINYDELLSDQIDDFHSLDLSVAYKWQPKQWKKSFLKISAHCFNAYNRDNIIKRQFYIDYTKSPFEMSFYDRKSIPRTFNFSLLYSY